MSPVELIGSLLAVFSLGVLSLFGLGLLQIHIANRQWANHRDRQHIDRVKVGKRLTKPVNYLHFVQHPADRITEARELGRALDVDGLVSLHEGNS